MTTTATTETPLSQPSTTRGSQQQEKMGIDIHKALSILSARSSSSSHNHGHVGHDGNCHNPHHHHLDGQVTTTSGAVSSSDKHACGGGCHGDPIPDNVEGMGQTIDLLATKTKDDASDNKTQSFSEEEEEQEKQRFEQQRRLKRKQQIQDELDQMLTRELLQYVMKTQQERVVAYRDYEK